MTVSVSLSVPQVEVRLTKVEVTEVPVAVPVDAEVRLTTVEGAEVRVAVDQPVVSLQPVIEPDPATVTLSQPQSPSVQVVLGVQGPKGDDGTGGGPGGAVRVTDNGVLVTEAATELNFRTGLTASENSDGSVDIDNTGQLGDATNIFERVNADIGTGWADVFYVQDATQGGAWRIRRVDNVGIATEVSSDDSAGAGLTTAEAWDQRRTLSYA